MNRRRFIACLAAGLAVSTAVVPAEARRGGRSDSDGDHERRERRESRRHEEDSLDAAVARIKRETGGRVLSAEKDVRRSETSYRIKVLLPNGSVRLFQVDAHGNNKD